MIVTELTCSRQYARERRTDFGWSEAAARHEAQHIAADGPAFWSSLWVHQYQCSALSRYPLDAVD
jgi:hypothetical protein